MGEISEKKRYIEIPTTNKFYPFKDSSSEFGKITSPLWYAFTDIDIYNSNIPTDAMLEISYRKEDGTIGYVDCDLSGRRLAFEMAGPTHRLSLNSCDDLHKVHNPIQVNIKSELNESYSAKLYYTVSLITTVQQ